MTRSTDAGLAETTPALFLAYVHKIATVVAADSHGLTDDAVGVYETAEIRFRPPQGGWTVGAKIRTPGVWGVQGASPSDLCELAKAERCELIALLAALGLEITDDTLKKSGMA